MHTFIPIAIEMLGPINHKGVVSWVVASQLHRATVGKPLSYFNGCSSSYNGSIAYVCMALPCILQTPAISHSSTRF